MVGLVSTAALVTPLFAVAPASAAVKSPSGDYVGMAPPSEDVPLQVSPVAAAENKLFALYASKLDAANRRSSVVGLDAKIREAQQNVVRLSGRSIDEIAPEPTLIQNIAKANSAPQSKKAAAAESVSRVAVSKLGTSQVGQQENNWCGPATGYVILKYKGKTSDGGKALSQSALAGPNYMRTGTGSTNWGDKDMSHGLNAWGGLGYHELPDQTPSVLRSTLLSKIDAGRPLAYGTVEYKNGEHYNEHPASKNVYHWITGYGYGDSGSTAYYQDSATTVWAGVHAERSMSTSHMSSFMGPYGAVA